MTTPDTPFRADDDAAAELRRLVDDYRSRCLWFLREDVLPDDPQRLQDLLRKIELRADRATYIQARSLREWLSRNSSAASAGS